MTSQTFFFVFIPVLSFILLAVNLIFASHNPYQEKDSVFECGFHSFLGQNRTQFSISFFIFALLFLLFDLEILLVYPYIVSAYSNSIYGLIIMLIFFLVLTLGFAYELGKNALKIDSRQMFTEGKSTTNFTVTSGVIHTMPMLIMRQRHMPSPRLVAKNRSLFLKTQIPSLMDLQPWNLFGVIKIAILDFMKRLSIYNLYGLFKKVFILDYPF